ncbi:helix-turn-helix transcriptional regulator [Actinopolymorpha rutila]|uniref:Putative ArsR family transcriptional regulator n=1 Tax=Actinopolymorpha rutila TaxID=446787 RepID=A0A852ZDL8_9ACTN|nr:helix-turn-helix domain-containing protein [Actinopolymorpha rutila]NYH91237.1 putative ArsR family transcriptional regulator [Actinopolymorpha rutila]
MKPSTDYGPMPAVYRPQRPLSQSRAALLGALRSQSEPTTLAALVAASGLHQNTVREHLDALIEDGLATRHPAESRGRGRPAWLYEPVVGGPERSEYAGLVSTLAAAIHRCSPNPRQEAIAAGADWGRELAGDRRVTATRGGPTARRKVIALLDDLGFAPETDTRATVVRLTRCPLLEAARNYPDVVCGAHLGVVRGALGGYGADPERADLLPFAEPGACRLELMTRKRPPGAPGRTTG